MASAEQLYALTAESIRKLRQDHEDLKTLMLTRKRGPKKWRFGGGGGGGETTVATTLGYVVKEAPRATESGSVSHTGPLNYDVTSSTWQRDTVQNDAGKYVPVHVNEDGHLQLVVPPGETLDSATFENASIHYAIPEGALIEVQTFNGIAFGRPHDPVDALGWLDNPLAGRSLRYNGTQQPIDWADAIREVWYDQINLELHKTYNDADVIWHEPAQCDA